MSSTIALHIPYFSRHGKRGYRNLLRVTSMVSCNYSDPAKENYFGKPRQQLSMPEIGKFSPNNSNIKLNTAEAGEYLVREAQLEEEYWMAAQLRAESHWEEGENARYAENFIRQFAEQEFNAMKKRYNAQLGHHCKCIVMVKEGSTSIKSSIVGTLDLSIRYFSHGHTFPGQRVKPPVFCLVDRKPSSSYGYIANLCVAKSVRRQGIATTMLQYVIFSAKAHGAEKLCVHVNRNNKPAQSLYQNMGFQVVDAATSPDQTYALKLRLA